jgi:hypothetical protein
MMTAGRQNTRLYHSLMNNETNFSRIDSLTAKDGGGAKHGDPSIVGKSVFHDYFFDVD